MLKNVASICAALIVAAAAFSAPAQAQRHRGGYLGHFRGGYHGHFWRGHRGGWGGFATGAIIGGMLAAPYYARPYYDSYYGSRYYYPGDDAVAYCMRRFRSYDPRSGTYLGYDGYRHPCP